jgi:large subunit ribosomal protein L13
MAMQKTYMAKPAEVEPKWWVVDAAGKAVGRLATEIAVILMGKHRPTYTPHVDTGDYVIVLNVDKVVFTGNKWDAKQYTWYTGYTGLRSETARERFEKKPRVDPLRRGPPHAAQEQARPEDARKTQAVFRPEHPHQAQRPEAIELGGDTK